MESEMIKNRYPQVVWVDTNKSGGSDIIQNTLDIEIFNKPYTLEKKLYFVTENDCLLLLRLILYLYIVLYYILLLVIS